MRIEKPGPHKKRKRPKIKPPAERHCRYFGYETGTERWCHAEAKLIKFLYGGGITGSKIPDRETAWLSYEADQILSKPLPKDATKAKLQEHARQWREVIERSHGMNDRQRGGIHSVTMKSTNPLV